MDDRVVVALFRHGLTELNKQKTYMGWTDEPICEEAKESLTALQPNPYQVVVTSDLIRCLQTAAILFPEKDPIPFLEFREMNFGPFERKRYEELAGDPRYEEWISSHFESNVPGAETFTDFTQRVENGWTNLSTLVMRDKVDSLAVVTHGGVLRYLLSKFAPTEKSFWEWRVPHGNGFEFVWPNRETFRRGERCTLLREVLLTENQHG
ncbi:histidine phosphatase family protein [Niallia sp. XMNu-256]|uniref:histidine phosphatase family protein n=1 Tax=Niallia sp. XMNu-256 TaxID=3082444 RepID=UPI0030D49D86